jgi:trehalose synthase
VIREVEVPRKRGLDDYAAVAHLARAVSELEDEARVLSPKLSGRTVWMVSSTAQGGGVAEMLPGVVGMLNELGVAARWVVIGTEQKGFFALTKRIHNAIHGADEVFTPADRELYAAVSVELAAEMRPRLAPSDFVVVHDPQPAGVGAALVAGGARAIWRSHIGLDMPTRGGDAAWAFLRPYLEAYEHAVFTLAQYAPPFLSDVSTITPGLDPLSHKNRELSTHKLVGVLACAGLIPEYGPMLAPPFARRAERLSCREDDIGLLYRPIVAQISRWDRLKGFLPLLEGFARLKRELPSRLGRYFLRERRSLELARLVLAGPEPGAVADDPEAAGVFAELSAAWKALSPGVREDIEIISLPADSRKNNALMVNALQRCATLIVQNSSREGFGLTVTEAMWKRICVLGSNAAGIRRQIQDGTDGTLLSAPGDPQAIADVLERLLTQARLRERQARNAQRRAHDEFLVFTQIRQWLRLLATRASLAP